MNRAELQSYLDAAGFIARGPQLADRLRGRPRHRSSRALVLAGLALVPTS